MSTRTRILDAADRLFSEHGIRAVGVDAIVAAADTAKTTLYAHFGSKDAVVVAYLRRRAERQQERLEQALARHRGSSVERVLHLYGLLAVELAEPGYRGSPFANASVELGAEHPAATVGREHRQWLLATFTSLVAETAASDPAAMAAQLLLLYEAAAQVGGDAARTAGTAAEGLLTAALAAPPRSPADPVQAGSSDLRTTAGPPGLRTTARPPEFLAAASRPAADGPEAHRPTPTAGLPTGGSVAAHRLVAFLNSNHLPDGDDQLADERAGPWLAQWLSEAGEAVRAGLAETAAPAELLVVREGLRELAAVNCGARADPRRVAQAAALLGRTPLLVDLAAGAEPRLTPAADADRGDPTVAGAVIAVVVGDYLALRARGEWSRLKVCASPECRWAFLDTTRNHRRRWCDMAGCGNRAKNRAWRRRQTLVTDKLV